FFTPGIPLRDPSLQSLDMLLVCHGNSPRLNDRCRMLPQRLYVLEATAGDLRVDVLRATIETMSAFDDADASTTWRLLCALQLSPMRYSVLAGRGGGRGEAAGRAC